MVPLDLTASELAVAASYDLEVVEVPVVVIAFDEALLLRINCDRDVIYGTKSGIASWC